MKRIFSSKIVRVLFVITFLNLLVLSIRDIIYENNIYEFLVWNLFLGLIPLLVVGLMVFFHEKMNKVFFLIGSFLWILFYPNAPYMISDLIHVNQVTDQAQLLYDTLIIFSISMLSVFYGFYSSYIIHGLLKVRIGTKWAGIVIGFSLLLCSFGIYLGRVLRLNSWDIFTKPLDVLKLILDHLFPISKNPSTYVMIIIFTGIQLMLLVLIKYMNVIGDKELKTTNSNS